MPMTHTLATIAGLAQGEVRLARPELIHWAWIAPLILAAIAFGAWRRRRSLARLADARTLHVLSPAVSRSKRLAKSLLLALAAAAGAVALAQPQHSPEEADVRRTGREIAFLVDVSRSMLARDLAPSRLERSKLWIADLVPNLRGDRIALVAFAGGASVRCPLTVDHDFFKLTLEELSPEAAPRGGTLIGDAIRKTLADVFNLDLTPGEDGEMPTLDADQPSARDIILITDGQDMESLPREAAELAAALGVRIIAIGVGSTDGPTPVPLAPDSRGYILDPVTGETVTSELEPETLREIALADPANRYLEVGTGEIDLASVYNDLIAAAEQADLGPARVTQYREAYWLFAAVALALLVAEALLGERRGPPEAVRPLHVAPETPTRPAAR